MCVATIISAIIINFIIHSIEFKLLIFSLRLPTEERSYQSIYQRFEHKFSQPVRYLQSFRKMTVVSRKVTSSHPAATLALKALASLVGLAESSITFSTEKSADDSDSFSVEMNVSSQNTFSGTNMGYTAHGLLGCARAICKAVPECGLWGQLTSGASLESLIESWIETAAGILVYPAYVASDKRGMFYILYTYIHICVCVCVCVCVCCGMIDDLLF